MKSTRRVPFVLSTLLLAALAFGVFWYRSFTSADDAPKEMVIDEEITNLEVNAENTDILLLPSENENTKLNVTGDSRNFSLNTHIQGKNLSIETENKTQAFGAVLEKQPLLTVYLGQPHLLSLTLTSTNGDIRAGDIEAYEISAETSKGDVDFENMSMKYIIARTDDGKISMRKLEAHLIKAESDGNLDMENIFGSLTGIASNGNIDIALDGVAYSMDLTAENGGIAIRSKEPPTDVRFEAQAENGEVDIMGENSNNLVYGDGIYLIKLAAADGDILFTSEK
ncbi:DUF4097 family beta strand repeat-containing protein [Planomicrobium sp. CPCC 101110]|uniref:DUF4097 family beta strand repeat-containing protein n=1 Tax=Planomicrobium sp. CPCC 101110 TaxID=2599619 RepID=UPI0011B3C5C2|nr:DUF4097 family beta strand repeat-containing protein [Planomicrobium sp. CPCC 101110]TWT25173.1 DUF4097 domain-containing protein [Planomicrobium sp. CPCC 101110]